MAEIGENVGGASRERCDVGKRDSEVQLNERDRCDRDGVASMKLGCESVSE